jgi:hypothetical protein
MTILLPLVFYVGVIPLAFAQDGPLPPPGSDLDQIDDIKTLADYWSQYKCYEYDAEGTSLEIPSFIDQCRPLCPSYSDPDAREQDFVQGSVSCFLDPKWYDTRTGLPGGEEGQYRLEVTGCFTFANSRLWIGHRMRIGDCSCNHPVINVLGEFFMDSVKEIGDLLKRIICPLLQALDVVIQIASAAIPAPGKAIQAGMSMILSQQGSEYS